ncbi:restriction endonuclease subunit S [Mitsuokella sp. WILCCON 0060]|uniref:restriction endonuclease subunit S n=1 Tax=unclassified Mitsuokella TaxID=2637239 RepID=UPI003F11423B
MKEKKNVPELRFPEFTSAWEQCKLGDIVKLNGRIGFRGYTAKDIITKEEGGILAFSPTNIVNNKINLNVRNTYITCEKYEESPEIKISNGDILFVKTGSTLGKSALVTGISEPASINPQVVVMRTSQKFRSFLAYELISDNVQRQITAVKIGGAVPTLTESEIKYFNIWMPVSEDESYKIGMFFSLFDKFMTHYQRKENLLKELKKGMLQKIFSQELRFKGDNGQDFPDWEEKTFGDVFDSMEYGMNASAVDYDGKHKYIRITDIDDATHKYIDDAPVSPSGEIQEHYAVKEGDILFARTGASVGKSYIYDKNDGELYFAGFLIRGSVKKEYSPYFIFLQTVSESYFHWVKITSMRTGQPGINSKEYKSFKFSCPSLPEQKKIADYFTHLDALITAEQEKLSSLQQMKKGFLQKMFV